MANPTGSRGTDGEGLISLNPFAVRSECFSRNSPGQEAHRRQDGRGGQDQDQGRE
jgi:hypothetical protein